MNKPIYITIETTVEVPVDKVWKLWITPEDIILWNFASSDWHTTKAENNLVAGGQFSSRMEAKDGSFGFDFSGIYDQVEVCRLIEYTLADDRKVKITFESIGEQTKITETFEAETSNPVEIQRAGWQAILENFKQYAESGIHDWLYV
jgi:uncharacterized protein YndB with AHSA1/START domain